MSEHIDTKKTSSGVISKNAEATAIAPDAQVAKIPGVNLNVALSKEVVIRVLGVDQSYKGKIVGYDAYEYIIAAVRLPSKIRKKLAFGGEIIVKYILEGTVYGFKTSVHNAVSSPTSLIFFDYPSVIEKIELRRESRIDVNLNGEVHANDGEHDCIILNVSETGCKLSVRASSRDPISNIKVEDTVMVVIDFGVEGALKLPIAVRNIKRGKGILTLGAMFIDINPNEEEVINKYLERVRRLTR
ncbi:flagellar brake protein [Pseudodesulfovibrio sediminis]|uniref:Type IV pilus assembly PilZ n=1 Tax=Pseudodesulfovibrio sediminis TaxID=2810563 RepID=A0ABN6EQ71_9BACT|nr:flagellar brake protein [Pseudodesulfovibrio sediminis]BCS88568.1 hypothetical protein PSDVSF_18100 [Pseudodesulfovibrio sediminis]